jgi:hypothetical protein
MSNTNNNSNIAPTAPGVIQPVVKPFPSGSYSARTAGIQIQKDNNTSQTRLIQTAHGGSKKNKRSKKGGAASQIAVPTMQVLYPEPGAGNQTVNGNITSTTSLGASSTANSVYDSCIGQGPACTAQVSVKTGGSNKKSIKRYKKRGGVKWGCYSGGNYSKGYRSKSKKRKNKSKSKSKKSKSRRKYY